MANKILPDTPWHVGYTKKEEDDPKRHKSRCIHIEDKICKCGKSGSFMVRCGGSAHCCFYSETLSEWDKLSEENKTAEDIERERIEEYKKIVQMKKDRFIKDKQNYFQYRDVEDIRECPICFDHLMHRGKAIACCSYCNTLFINESTVNLHNELNKEQDIFIMGKSNQVINNYISNKTKVGCCKLMNTKTGRCLQTESFSYGKRCNKQGCKEFKKK